MSQQSNVQSVTDLAGLTHEVFRGSVLPNVRTASPTAQLFREAGEGDFTLRGKKLVGAVDLQRAHGAMATSGHLPDHAHFDAVQWETTPTRRYRRFAMDNFTEARATGEGAFEDLAERIFRQLWDAYRLMEIRHSVGGSTGTLCKVMSRTSATVWVAKDAYGHTGTPGAMLLEPGMIIAYIDVSNSNAVGGAGKIASIAASTQTVTMSASWEGANNAAANDLVVAATTTSTSASYFDTERNNAKHGLMDIVDPGSSLTTVLNISQTTHPRWMPYRQASSTFDTIEVTEFARRLGAKSSFTVTPSSHTMVAQPGVVSTLARTLLTYQRQMDGLGMTFKGGYKTVKVGEWDIMEDQWQLHNVLYCICTEDLYTVSLVDQGFFDDDGSMYSRIADYDGKEGYARDYCQSFSNRRNRNGALTGITLHSASPATAYDPTPNY